MTKCVIANRGEIARRILSSARRRGYRVAVISTPADSRALVRREADEVLETGSFLDASGIVGAASRWGADLLHPGYGYLSENASFAGEVEGAGIGFVGPTGDNMRALGDKEGARRLAQACGVPVLPALLSSEIASLPEAEWEGALLERGIRPPYIIKASGGGGGKGMRRVERPEELPPAVRRASEEARAAFADGTVFIERCLVEPRHVEIQVFGDGRGGGVFWGERECSLQRRHQKVFEEAPSSVVGPELREAMGRAALSLVRAARYRGAGTVEFLLDAGGRFSFLEMNTRLQVEHPVTEMVYGIDLVDAQFELAEGRWPAVFPSPDAFSVPVPRGQAFEARILAEDPRNGFLPTPGPILRYREPAGEGVRVDTGVCEGSEVATAFDSLLAKLVVHGKDRPEALDRMARALEGFVIHGCGTNLPFLHALCLHPQVRAGRISTDWIPGNLETLNAPRIPEALGRLLRSPELAEKVSRALAGGDSDPAPGHAARFASQAEVFPSQARYSKPRARVRCGGHAGELLLEGPALGEALAEAPPQDRGRSGGLRDLLAKAVPGGREPRLRLWATHLPHGQIEVSCLGETLRVEDPRCRSGPAAGARDEDGEIRAPMAGKVIEARARPGEMVVEGQVLFVVESMKMQLEVLCSADGVVGEVFAKVGQVLSGPDLLAKVTASG